MNVLAINAMLAGPGLVAYLGEGSRFTVYIPIPLQLERLP